MALLLGFALLWFFAAETSTCKYNEYTIESESGNLTCLKCRKCRAGSGLLPQCGTRIKDNDKKNVCKPCILGKTYSAHDDISSCEPCDTCSNHQTVVKTCTLYSDSQCKDTCSKGFYFEDLTGDCQPCTWCCSDGSNKVRSGCKEMPFYKQCDANTAENCKPKCQSDQYVVPGRKGGGHCENCDVCPPGTSPFPECGSVVENMNNISCREGERSHFKGWHAGILAGGIFTVIILALFLRWKFCRRGSPGFKFRRFGSPEENGEGTVEVQSSQTENLTTSGNSGDPESIQTCGRTSIPEGPSRNNNGSATHEKTQVVTGQGHFEATVEVHESSQPENLTTSENSGDPAPIQTCERTPIPEGPSGNNNSIDTHDQNHVVTEQGSKSLESLVHDLSNSVDKIFQRLDTRIQGAGHYDYEIIGNHFGYNHFEIKSMVERCDGSPSRAILEAIAVYQPELTVEEFARVVEAKTRRKDVVQLLRAYDRVLPKESV